LRGHFNSDPRPNRAGETMAVRQEIQRTGKKRGGGGGRWEKNFRVAYRKKMEPLGWANPRLHQKTEGGNPRKSWT